MDRTAKAVVIDLGPADNRAPGGVMTSVKEVGYDGRYWWWVGGSGAKNSYDGRFPNQAERFRYTLSQELMSSQKAWKLVQKLRDEWAATNPGPAPSSVPALASELLKVAKELAADGKDYYLQMNVGKAKYVVNFHDGSKTHRDGSPFYDVRTFKNKPDMEAFVSELSKKGYREGRHVASELLKVAKEVAGYGYHKSCSGDPYWITLKFPGACAKCKKPLERGEKAYWYPRTRTMFGESCGHGREAEIDFHNSVEMEEGHLV